MSTDTKQQSGRGLMSSPSYIPAMHSVGVTPAPRTLVLCFDGTGDQFDADNSNVVQLFSLLKKDDRKQQMVYYQAGIGTYTSQHFATPGMAKLSKKLDAAFAWNLDVHLMEGYEFLMQNYEAGDKICIFGFSRGAYTARALAGMIHKVGLLPACNHQQVPFAYKMYKRTSAVGWAQSTAFKKTFSIDVDVDFIGVWDTVSSVGAVPRRLPFTSSNTSVKVFRHAVSLDERRAKFKANLFHRPTAEEKSLGVQAGEMPKAGTEVCSEPGKTSAGVKKHVVEKKKQETRKSNKNVDRDESDSESDPEWQDAMEKRFSMMDSQPLETDVLEVWFAGCHCDVGGGSVPNNTRHNLARIPLRWMIRQCFLTNTGIRFHSELLKHVGLDPSTLYPVAKPRPEAVYAPVFRSLKEAVQEEKERRAKEKASSKKDKEKTWRVATLKFSPFGLTLPRSWPSEGNKLTLRKRARSEPAPPLVPSNSEFAEGSSSSPDGNVPLGLDSTAAGLAFLTEEEEDLADALAPIYDQLKMKRRWWVLEIIPMRHRVQKEDDNWRGEVSLNLGKGRKAPRHEKSSIYVHRSVKIRMEAHASLVGGCRGRKYVPKAKLDTEPTWVD